MLLVRPFSADEVQNEKLWLDLQKGYSQKNRAYHNLNHIKSMLGELKSFEAEVIDLPVLQFAIWYHDLVYKAIRKDNELKSAEHAQEVMQELGFDAARVERAFRLIMITKSHELSSSDDGDAQLLVDFYAVAKQGISRFGRCFLLLKFRTMKKRLKHSMLLLLMVCSFYLLLLIFPNPLFAHQYEYQNFKVYSDQPIPSEIEAVLDDAGKRLEHSEIYHADHSYSIFICQDNWRFKLLTRNGNAGGLVNFFISSHVFIRECDIRNNRIIPPGGWMYDPIGRPLSYFVAHEITHAMQRNYDPLMIFKTPSYIMEGYADYIGKAGHFDYEKYKAAYLKDGFVKDMERGLYSKYHFYVAYLMEVKGYSFEEVLEKEIGMEVLGEVEE